MTGREPGDLSGLVVRLLGFALAGFVLGALAGAAIGIANMVLNPACGAPGGEEECAVLIQEAAIAAGVLGLPIGLFVGLLRRR
jgi:hypothetical protein